MLYCHVLLHNANCNIGINVPNLWKNPCISQRIRYNRHIHYYKGGKAPSYWNEISSAPHLR